MRLFILIVLTLTMHLPVHGDLISSGILGTTSADFATASDTDNSSLTVSSISSLATADNSYTQSDLSWNWSNNVLAGSSLLTGEKTVSARPGGEHIGSSDLVLQFTVDSLTNYSLDGTWGFVNIQPGGDSLSVVLSDGAGTIDSDSTTSTSGINSNAMSMSGTIGAGTYTLSISGLLTETINNQGIAQAGWNITGFSLTNAAIPEPQTFALLFLLLAACITRSSTRSA